MQNLKGIAFVLILVAGTSSVLSQSNIGRCVDLLTSAASTQSFCDAMKIYTKCVIKELNLHKVAGSDSILQILQSSMNAELAKQGVTNCDLNIAALVAQLRVEELFGITETTRRPPSFDTAVTIGDCTTALTNAGISTGGITCGQATDYTRCAIRVLGFLNSNPTAQDIQAFEVAMETQLRSSGLSCDLDVQAIINGLRSG